MRLFRHFIVLLIGGILLYPIGGSAQTDREGPRVGSSILNDSVRNVYGPTTTRWTTEQDLFDNRGIYQPIDTTLRNYHRWTYVQQFDYTLQDLGVMGTALNPLYPTLPSSIGAQSGFTAYERYYTTQEPRYFDTKSPYTKLKIIWGGAGRALTDIQFSRNINPRWNFGFNYRPILVEKQIQSKGKADKQTTSHYYDFYTTFRTKNNKYAVLFNFRRIRHRVVESGGVKATDGDFNALFDANAVPKLTAAKTEEYRRNIHLSHRYQIDTALQLYHIADMYEQTNGFVDVLSSEPSDYYDQFVKLGNDSINSNDLVTFRSEQHEAGIKGRADRFFYSTYLKYRHYSYEISALDTIANFGYSTKGSETYVGGRISYRLDSITQITGAAEYLFGGFYRIEGNFSTPWLDGSFRNMLVKPGMMQQRYLGSHDDWTKTFDATNLTEARGFIKVHAGPLNLNAGGTFILMDKYIYFEKTYLSPDRTEVLPVQSTGLQSTFTPEVKAEIQIGRHFFFRPRVMHTSFLKNDDNALSIPTWFVNAQFTYENILFNKHLQLQLGVETHWHSAYQAMGYDAPTQQYYLQREYLNPSFGLVDVFFNGKMRRGRFFFKYHNLVQSFTKTGYVPTPGYPGQRNLIDFGFEFLLFD